MSPRRKSTLHRACIISALLTLDVLTLDAVRLCQFKFAHITSQSSTPTVYRCLSVPAHGISSSELLCVCGEMRASHTNPRL